MKAIKRTLAMVCLMATIFTVCSVGASAANYEFGTFGIPVNLQDRAAGNGWVDGTIVLNGKTYDYTLSMNYNDRDKSFISQCTTDAAINRFHDGVEGVWDTEHYGYVSNEGRTSSTGVRYGTSESEPAEPPETVPKNEILGPKEGSGRIVMYADSQKSQTVRMWN